jgi:hypothetical protein
MALNVLALSQTGGVVNGLIAPVAPDPTSTAFPAVNTIMLAGQEMPGSWVLNDADKVFGWQVQKAFGLSGATVFPIGDEIVAPKFTVSLWTTAQMLVFREVRKVLLKKPVFSVGATTTSKALGIDHPELKALGVTAVVVKRITPIINDGTGLWSCTVEFYQWRKPVLAPPKPSTAIPDAAPPQPTAQDNQDIEIQRLRAERAALGKVP